MDVRLGFTRQNRPWSYIGVTEIGHLDEVRRLARLRAAATLPPTHHLAVSALVSDATLRGEAPTIAR